jgi:hypothetical protein
VLPLCSGSGKTYTIFGPPGSLTEASLSGPLDSEGVPPAWGLFPRLAMALLRLAAHDAGTSLTLHASAVEIYSEHAYDLLADRAPLSVGSQKAGRNVGGGATCLTSSGDGAATSGAVGAAQSFHGVHPPACRCGKCFLAKKEELAARLARRDVMQAKGGPPPPERPGKAGGTGKGAAGACDSTAEEEAVSTVGETRMELRNAADIAKLARTVELTRVATGHLLNARSSRSHCLVHLHLTEHRGGGGGRASGMVYRQKLLCVDLAGSERILKSGVEGLAQKQAVGINSSLTALGKVVRAVGEGAAHVPYRDSTLTQLLRSSLGGKSCTSVVVALASEAEHADETVCSVEFAKRMAVVRTRATVVSGQDAATEVQHAARTLEAARAELERLETQGFGERFGEAADVTTIASFQDNVRRKAEKDTEALAARGRLAEVLARGGKGTAEALSLQSRAEGAELESANLRDIVLRQKSIKGFWIAPKAGYVKKQAEVRELQARLRMLSTGL